MGILAATVLFFFMAWINLLNAKYLIEATDGIKKRVMKVSKEELSITNDYAKLMYQVVLPFLHHQIAVRKERLLPISLHLLRYDVGYLARNHGNPSPPLSPKDRCDGQCEGPQLE